jgi:hypothetical protein
MFLFTIQPYCDPIINFVQKNTMHKIDLPTQHFSPHQPTNTPILYIALPQVLNQAYKHVLCYAWWFAK